MSEAQTLLVTGASGHLGRRVVEILLEAGSGPIIAATRNPEKLADVAAKGADVRRADFDDPASLATAFAGVDRLLLISTDAVGRPGGRHAQHKIAVTAAVEAGVKHVVYTSAIAPRPTPEESVLNDHFWTEQALAASPLGWTVLRNNIYADMLLMGLPHAVQSGELATATDDSARNYVTREDCARAAAAALAADFDGRRILEINGPEPVTLGEVAAIAGEITGRAVKHVAVSPDQLHQGLVSAGMPPVYADSLVAFDVDAAEGFHAHTTPALTQLTGAAPITVREFLTSNRQALLAAA